MVSWRIELNRVRLTFKFTAFIRAVSERISETGSGAYRAPRRVRGRGPVSDSLSGSSVPTWRRSMAASPMQPCRKATFCDRCHSAFVIVLANIRAIKEPAQPKESSMSKIISALAFATLLSLPASAAVASPSNYWKITTQRVLTIPACPALEGYPDCRR